jgi:hypothetical protein
MLTLFDILPLCGACIGLALGATGGAGLLGTPGGVIGAVVGCAVGFVAGRLPFLLRLRRLSRDLAAKSTAELRADLRNPNCPTPNLVLLELRRRGEDIRAELPVVLDLLASEDFGRRGTGWAALTSAFPELAVSLSDYRLDDPVEECRRKTGRLRVEAEPQNGVGSQARPPRNPVDSTSLS